MGIKGWHVPSCLSRHWASLYYVTTQRLRHVAVYPHEWTCHCITLCDGLFLRHYYVTITTRTQCVTTHLDNEKMYTRSWGVIQIVWMLLWNYNLFLSRLRQGISTCGPGMNYDGGEGPVRVRQESLCQAGLSSYTMICGGISHPQLTWTNLSTEDQLRRLAVTVAGGPARNLS